MFLPSNFNMCGNFLRHEHRCVSGVGAPPLDIQPLSLALSCSLSMHVHAHKLSTTLEEGVAQVSSASSQLKYKSMNASKDL